MKSLEAIRNQVSAQHDYQPQARSKLPPITSPCLSCPQIPRLKEKNV